MAITATIVNVTAQVTAAPAPSTLQQTGALVSFGGTTQTTNAIIYYGTLADVEAALSGAGNHAELLDMATTFFAQGGAVGVSIVELGVQASVPTQITDLGTWITANPNTVYAFLTPAAWDAQAADVAAMAAAFSGPTGKTYFFITASSGTLATYGTNKAFFATVPAAGAPGTEFTPAAFFYEWLANNPSAATPAQPMQYRFLFGVTPWIYNGNATVINAILTAFGNLVLTGAEGGISTSCIFKGTTMDGNQAMYWYAVDWMQITGKQQLAAAIIQGSNQSPPLQYSQQGINTLLAVLTNEGSTGISFGLLKSAVPTATPFSTYVAQNPSNYAAGIYNGFQVTVLPQLGFESITFAIDAVEFAS